MPYTNQPTAMNYIPTNTPSHEPYVPLKVITSIIAKSMENYALDYDKNYNDPLLHLSRYDEFEFNLNNKWLVEKFVNPKKKHAAKYKILHPVSKLPLEYNDNMTKIFFGKKDNEYNQNQYWLINKIYNTNDYIIRSNKNQKMCLDVLVDNNERYFVNLNTIDLSNIIEINTEDHKNDHKLNLLYGPNEQIITPSKRWIFENNIDSTIQLCNKKPLGKIIIDYSLDGFVYINDEKCCNSI